jgi:hypothetical protein
LHGTRNLSTDSPQTPLHAEIGYRSIRLLNHFKDAWGQIQTTEGGAMDFSAVDDIVGQAEAQEIEVLWCFRGLPSWTAVDDPDLNASFMAFVDAASRRYAGRRVSYQLWNEPDAGTFWPGNDVNQFIAMVTGAVALIKANDPSAKVVAPCMTASGSTWLSALVASGAMNGVDALSVNCYVYPFEPENILGNIRPFMVVAAQYGLPLYNTEITWNSFRETPGGSLLSYPTAMSAEQGAGYLVRAMLAFLRAGVAKSFWFGPDEDFASLVQFGCIPMLTNADRVTLLPPALAYQYFISTVAGGKLSDWTLSGTLRTARFRKGGVTGRIFWRGDGATGDIDLSAYSSGTDMYGAPITLSSAYPVTSSPIYVFA